MDLDVRNKRGWTVIDLALYPVGIAGLAVALTIAWLVMRAVLDVGGYCAEGGPYEIAQHCPDGVGLLMPLSIFGGLGCAGLVAWKGAVLGDPYGGLVLLAWPALFISLGWNFLQFAFFPSSPDTGIELGFLIPGILFVIMGAVPLIGFLPGGKNWKSTPEQPAYDFSAEGEARYQHQLAGARSQLLSELVTQVGHRASGDTSEASPTEPSTEDSDLVGKLERVSVLYKAGTLTHAEFQQAKQALIDEASK